MIGDRGHPRRSSSIESVPNNTLDLNPDAPTSYRLMEIIIFSIVGSGLLIAAHWLTVVRERFFASN